MGILERLAAKIRRHPQVPDTLSREALEKGYKLAFSQLREDGTVAPLGLAITREHDLKWCMPDDGDAESVQAWLREGCAQGRFVEVYLFCVVDARSDGTAGSGERMLACYVDSPGRGPCRLVLTPYILADAQLTCGRGVVRETSERIAQ